MKKGLIIILVLFCSVQIHFTQAESTFLTVQVADVYEHPIDGARISVDYRYPQDDDTDIPDQFTTNGVAVFSLEDGREYTVTVEKAGFLSGTETVELEGDTTITVTLEYAQKMPILHVKRYSVSPQETSPGEQFHLYVVIENEGTADALNVKVTFDPAEDFSPVQPSSSAHFDRLDLGQIISLYQTFAVSGETESGVYNLGLTVTYSDAADESYVVQESVGVSILRKLLIKLLNVEYPQEAEQGEPFTFSVEIANTGRYTVNGVYLEIESDMNWEYYSYYVGSLEAGDFDTFVSEVMSEDPGEHTFTVRVGFVDDFNREHHEEQSFSLFIKEKVEETPSPQQNEGLWSRIITFLKSLLGLD